MESFSIGTEAIWSKSASIVHRTHRLVTGVSWDLNMPKKIQNDNLLVLYDVFFDNRSP